MGGLFPLDRSSLYAKLTGPVAPEPQNMFTIYFLFFSLYF